MFPHSKLQPLFYLPKPVGMLGVDSRDQCSEVKQLSQLFLLEPLYLLIYFPDCCLTSLKLRPPQPLQWLMAGVGLGSLSSWCCEG